MNDSTQEIEKLSELHKGTILLKEGDKPVVLLPEFGFISGGRELTMDLLLVPFEHSGYVTRLFFERRIEGRGNNWKQHRVVDRNWWAPSWNNVPAGSSWTAMLCDHLRAVA